MKVGVLGSVGLVLLIYTVIALMQKIESAFNFVWQVEHLRPLSQRFSNYRITSYNVCYTKLLREWLDSEIDHTLLLHKDDPVLPVLQAAGERVKVTQENPTAEHIARMIFEYVAGKGFPSYSFV